MKKILTAILCAAMILSLTACTGQDMNNVDINKRPEQTSKPVPSVPETTYVFSENDLAYEDIGDGIKITDCLIGKDTYGENAKCVIPSEINGKKVIEIGDSAFEYGKFTGIIIPEGVTQIGQYAFRSCDQLSSVNIPDGVTVIRNSTFNFCENLSKVTIPENVTEIEMYAFQSSGLTTVTIPKGVVSIGYLAFLSDNLESINVEEGNKKYFSDDGILYVRGNDGACFYTCPPKRTGDVIIPDGVAEIGNAAFNSCKNITSITIPASVTYIDDPFAPAYVHCFASLLKCENLINITVADGNSNYLSLDGMLCERQADGTITLMVCPRGRDGEITIPDSVNAIYGNAFGYNTNKTNITVPDSVSFIQNRAFDERENVKVNYKGEIYRQDNIDDLYGLFNQ